jgi:hypothetical protein
MQISFGLLKEGKDTPAIDIGEWTWKHHARIEMEDKKLRELVVRINDYLESLNE